MTSFYLCMGLALCMRCATCAYVALFCLRTLYSFVCLFSTLFMHTKKTTAHIMFIMSTRLSARPFATPFIRLPLARRRQQQR